MHTLKESAGYNGVYHDGGSASLLSRLDEFNHSLVVKHDLQPSEYNQLSDIDVGEPGEFSSIIDKYKLKLAKQIMKDIEL